MRALLQCASRASVSIGADEVASIGRGLLVFLGVGGNDTEQDAERLWRKVSRLRVFDDEDGKTNLSLAQVGGEVLIVSQFTLYASCKKGNRPSFGQAKAPDEARRLYEFFVDLARRDEATTRVEHGEFGATMDVALVNHGPFTVWLDTDEL